ncbi:hypothetical protein [Vibrio sp. 10N.261.46.A3]|uniref:hypothetical protein n=1 Tax=Vibrio sp. 10N.261.46.A3 TaxID=3229658 RepID=UPI0035536FB9
MSVDDYHALQSSMDTQALFGASEALALFGACASLYALVFVYKLARQSMGL